MSGSLAAALAKPINWREFWATDHKAEDWLCEPILPRGRSIATYSPAKVGKSLQALYVAAALATGARVFDRAAGDPLSVVYSDFEMTEGDVAERLEVFGYGPESDLSRLHYYLLPSLPPFDTPDGGDAALEIATRHHADLFIIDTTSRVLSGEENSADTLRAFYLHTGLRLKAAGVTVWRLDHAGKDAARGQRGTSAKADDVDLVWELSVRDGGFRLRATHRRQAWIPEVVDLSLFDDPLRYERPIEASWPSGTSETAAMLDELGVAYDAKTRDAQHALKEAGRGVRRAVLVAAMKWRQRAHPVLGTTSGTTDSETSGTTSGNQAGDSFGNHDGNHAEPLLAATGNQVPPLRGEPVLGPVEQAYIDRRRNGVRA